MPDSKNLATDRTADEAMDAWMDTRLREALQAGDEPPDDGFTWHVMAALPARASRRERTWARWPAQVHLIATCMAGGGVALLASGADALRDPANQLAVLTMVALLAFWAIPSRWTRP